MQNFTDFNFDLQRFDSYTVTVESVETSKVKITVKKGETAATSDEIKAVLTTYKDSSDITVEDGAFVVDSKPTSLEITSGSNSVAVTDSVYGISYSLADGQTTAVTINNVSYKASEASGTVNCTAENAVTLTKISEVASGTTDTTLLATTFTLGDATATKIGKNLTFTSSAEGGKVKLGADQTTVETITPASDETIKVSGAAFTLGNLTYSNSTPASTEVTFGTDNAVSAVVANTTVTAKTADDSNSFALGGVTYALKAADDAIKLNATDGSDVTVTAGNVTATLGTVEANTKVAVDGSATFEVSNVKLTKGDITISKEDGNAITVNASAEATIAASGKATIAASGKATIANEEFSVTTAPATEGNVAGVAVTVDESGALKTVSGLDATDAFSYNSTSVTVTSATTVKKEADSKSYLIGIEGNTTELDISDTNESWLAISENATGTVTATSTATDATITLTTIPASETTEAITNSTSDTIIAKLSYDSTNGAVLSSGATLTSTTINWTQSTAATLSVDYEATLNITPTQDINYKINGTDYTASDTTVLKISTTDKTTSKLVSGALKLTTETTTTTSFTTGQGKEFKLISQVTSSDGTKLDSSFTGLYVKVEEDTTEGGTGEKITVTGIDIGDEFSIDGVTYTGVSGGLQSSDGKLYAKDDLTSGFVIGTNDAYVDTQGSDSAALILVAKSSDKNLATFAAETLEEVANGKYKVQDAAGVTYGELTVGGTSSAKTYSFANASAAGKLDGGITTSGDITVSIAKDFSGTDIVVGSQSYATSLTGALTLDAANSIVSGLSGILTGDLHDLKSVNGKDFSNAIADGTSFSAIGNGSSITGVSGINSANGYTDDFSKGFVVNGETVKVTGDEEITVAGESTTDSKKVGSISGINAGAVLASVGSASIANLTGFSSEGQITIGSAAYTVKSAATDGTAALGLSGTKLIGVDGLSEAGYITGDLTGLTSIGSTDTKVTISGDSSMTLTSDTAVSFSGVGGNVTMTGAAMAGASVTTDSVGSFKLGSSSAISVAGDSSVTFGLGTDTAVASIANFDAGTISGSLNGITFATGTTVGAAALEISGDSSIAMVAADGALSISNLSNNAVLTNAGGATKALTDQAGKFTFGNQVVSVAGDSSVEFALDTDGKVSGVASITSATLNVDSSTTELKINGAETAVSLSAADSSKGTNLMFDASGNLSTVSGASSVDGLGESNLTVIGGTSGLSVAGTSIAITGDSAFNVAVVEGKVGEITGISDKATVAYGNGTLKTDTEGTFVLGGTSYVVSGDDAITFLTGEAGSLSAVQDLVGTIKTATTSMSINGDEVSISLASGEPTLTYAADASGITAISGLTNGATVTGAVDAAIAMAVDSSVGTLTANDVVYEILSGDKDGVTITGGSAISGLDNGAYMTVGAAGQYTVNGTALNLSYGDTIQGTDGGNTAKIYSESDIQEIPESISSNVEEIAKTIIDTTEYATLSTSEQESVVDAVTGASSDKSAADGDMKLAVGNSDSSEAQNVDFSSNTGKKDVTLTTGEQAIKFNNEGGNVAEIGKDATGTKAVELGDGGDVVAIAKGTKAEVNVVAGKGADTIVSGADATVDVGNGGATKVRATSGATVTMNNYDATTSKAGVQTTSSDIAAAIQNGFINLTDGAVSTGEGSNKSTVVVNGTSSSDLVESADTSTEGSTVVNLYNDKGKMTKVGFTHSEGGSVDLSGQKAAVVMQGNNVTGSSSKTGESTIISGSGNDTIFAGAGDVVDAGAGANTLVLASERNSAETGAVIQMNSATGRNKVQNFKTGFADGDDAVVVDLSSASFTVDDSGNVIVKNGRARTTIEGSASADATDSYTSMLVQDSASGVTYKAALASEGNTIAVSADEESFADAYVGNGSGLDFTSYEGTATVDLTSGAVLGGSTFDGQSVVVQGINSVALGESDGAAYGSADKETLKAGSGTASIWSGAGKDLMVGFSGSDDDKNGVATFAFLTGDGKDTISGFHALTADNANTADKIFTTANFDFSDVKVSSEGNVVLHFADNSSDVLTLTNVADKNIQVAVGALDATPVVFKAGISAVTYDGLATQYIATANSATVSASSEVSSANIWLENQFNLDSNSYVGNFKAIDASKVEGQATLVGNSFENVITAAQENTSMWGGSSTSNDTLIGGNGNDMFFYGVTGGNEGNDTITGVTEDDTINLFGITLDQIDLENTVANKSTITVKFNAGGSLTMASSGQTFILANDTNQSYKYDKDESTWVQA